LQKKRYEGPGCSARNKWGDPCWATPTLQNPMHQTLPLCWMHLAKVLIAGVSQPVGGKKRALPNATKFMDTAHETLSLLGTKVS